MQKSKRGMLAVILSVAICLTSALGVCAHYVAKAMGQGAPQKGSELPINFPELDDFAEIDAGMQSCDPDVYNFQMKAKRNGLFFYFVQNLPTVVTTNADNWNNTHVEMEIWQGDFGYGWSGTYIALFLDGSIYINNTANVRTYYSQIFSTQTAGGVKLEYYFWIEFDNNSASCDAPYAYVKQFQYLPNVSAALLPNSLFVNRDGRALFTGAEESWGVHERIDERK